MDDKIYTITLADGTELKNLRLNGDNYISQTEIDESVFEDNLAILTIRCGDETEVLRDAELIQLVQYGDGWYFVLHEMSETEKRNRTIEGDLTNLFLAMAEVYEMLI